MTSDGGSRRVIATYVVTNGLFTLGASLIWSVNTLFLLGAGLDIFQVMIVNSTFTVGQLVFEVPTGVVADTVGRKASFLLSVAVLAVSTVLYVLTAQMHWGIAGFIVASVLIGLGFTFQTGAVDAWLVDALDATGYDKPKERIFALGAAVFSSATLVGTMVGGFLGQVNLVLPYYLRAASLVFAFVAALILMRDQGFTPRPLSWSTFGDETRKIARAGITYGWQSPVVRPILWVSALQGVFFLYGFYALPPFLLAALGRDYVWIMGVVLAGFSIMGIAGNAFTGRVMTRRDGTPRRASVALVIVTAFMGACTIAMGLIGGGTPWFSLPPGGLAFGLLTGLWLGVGFGFGIAGPVGQGYINRHIPSEQRATVLSLSSFFGDGGAIAGQLGLGWLAKTVGLGISYVIGGVAVAASAPLYAASGRAAGEVGGGRDNAGDASAASRAEDD